MPAGPSSHPVKRAVLSLSGGPVDERIVDFGCKLARADQSQLVAVYVVEVDWRHSLDDDLVSERERASRALDLAEHIAEGEKVTLRTQLLQARDIGAAIVDEALSLKADAIVLGLPYKVRFGGDFAMGETIPYVFKNAPCAVYVVREPIAASEARDGAEVTRF